MLEHPKALSTHHNHDSENLKDNTMDNQQETNKVTHFKFNKNIFIKTKTKKRKKKTKQIYDNYPLFFKIKSVSEQRTIDSFKQNKYI
jgi:hypothetical protein